MFFKGLIFVFFYVAVTVFSLKNGTCKTFYFEKCLLCPYGETEQFEILCDNAKLKDIPDAFKEFEALKISNDDIIILPSLRNFSKLIRLDLNYDGIRLVLDDAIANLASLIHLSLSHNHIIDLGSKTFEGLENLSYLSLASNSIYLIDSQLFTENNVPKLTYLYLNENNIVKVEKGSFHGLSNLVLLDLSMNRIESLEKFATHSHQLMSLKTLNLGYNKISQIPVDFFEFIPSLEQLSLEHNFLKSVSQPDFILLSGTLVIMNLQGNLISEVKSKCFQNLNKLEKIDLSHNQLKDLKIKALPDNKFSHDNISLTLLIYGNPINCSNCDNSWMVAYPTLKAVNHQNETLCVIPVNVTFRDAEDLLFHHCNHTQESSMKILSVVIFLFISFSLFALVILYAMYKLRKKRQANATLSLGERGGSSPSKGAFSYHGLKEQFPFSIDEADENRL